MVNLKKIFNCLLSFFHIVTGQITPSDKFYDQLYYGPGYRINMKIVLKNIPSGVSKAVLYYNFKEGALSENFKNDTILYVNYTQIINMNTVEAVNDITLKVAIYYPKDVLCNKFFVTKLVYKTNLSETDRQNPCYKEDCKINHNFNECIDINISHNISSPHLLEGRESQIINELKEMYPDNEIEYKYLPIYENGFVNFTCNINKSENIRWIQTFDKDENIIIENKFRGFKHSKLRLQMHKSDNLTKLYCEAEKAGNVSISQIYLLYIINEENEITNNGENLNTEPTFLTPYMSGNLHNCSGEKYDSPRLVSYSGGKTKFLNENIPIPSLNDMEIFCVAHNTSISELYPSGEEQIQNFSVYKRIIYNRNKYNTEINDAKWNKYISDNWKIIIGVLFAIFVLCSIIWVIIKYRQRFRLKRDNTLNVAIYSTTNEVQYAQLCVTQTSNEIRGRDDLSPYAEIIGVLQPKQLK